MLNSRFTLIGRRYYTAINSFGKNKSPNFKYVNTLSHILQGMTQNYTPPKLKQLLLYNNICLLTCRGLNKEYFKDFYKTMREGSKVALRYIFDNINNNNLDALSKCCEEKLYSKMFKELNEVRQTGVKFVINLEVIKNCTVDNIEVLLGLQRGDRMIYDKISNVMGLHIPMYTNKPFKHEDLVNEIIDRGAIAMVDVSIKVKQKLFLYDLEGNNITESYIDTFNTLEYKYMLQPIDTIHLLRFENSIIPNTTNSIFTFVNQNNESFRQEPFQCTEWILCDFNGILNKNYPLDVSI
ncbi:hypothetical protein ACR3K2_34250 [Cryptosporidium serpentis]